MQNSIQHTMKEKVSPLPGLLYFYVHFVTEVVCFFMLGRYGVGFSYTMIMIMLAIVLTAAFVIYDIAFSELGRLYITKYSSKIRGNQNVST